MCAQLLLFVNRNHEKVVSYDRFPNQARSILKKKAHPVEPDAPKQGEACVFTEVRQSCGLFCHTCG